MTRMVGWRERAALPQLGISNMSAKMDTGALSCSLHAKDIEITNHDGTWNCAPKRFLPRIPITISPKLLTRFRFVSRHVIAAQNHDFGFSI